MIKPPPHDVSVGSLEHELEDTGEFGAFCCECIMWIGFHHDSEQDCELDVMNHQAAVGAYIRDPRPHTATVVTDPGEESLFKEALQEPQFGSSEYRAPVLGPYAAKCDECGGYVGIGRVTRTEARHDANIHAAVFSGIVGIDQPEDLVSLFRDQFVGTTITRASFSSDVGASAQGQISARELINDTIIGVRLNHRQNCEWRTSSIVVEICVNRRHPPATRLWSEPTAVLWSEIASHQTPSGIIPKQFLAMADRGELSFVGDITFRSRRIPASRSQKV